MAAKDDPPRKLVAENRKARHNYFIEDVFEAGMALLGTEVKSLRAGKCNLGDAYARDRGGELYLENAHISEYTQAGPKMNHPPLRPRKLLLKTREINKIKGAVQREGYTVVPLSIYFNDKGRAKCSLGLAKGKKKYDKRETEKARDWQRQKQRLVRGKGKSAD